MTRPRPKVPGGRIPGVQQQLTLPAQTYPCPSCSGKGWQEFEGARRHCRTCQGTALVEYDPDDRSLVGF